ncbi:hypothetical protein [Bradyrhizobium yuanmingense]|uniref:Uncharacterized protein n=1 Tax=Bradyrhizobium yuanmingense TaxID=108015 RepID=A0ABV4GCP4_9BRAD|nr:hypothetical protein [Bradyrhizobium yuanmingense]
MQPPFHSIHLDPSRDPPEAYWEAFELFEELWARLRGFKASCGQDQVLLNLIRHLEHQLVIAGLILAFQLELLDG